METITLDTWEKMAEYADRHFCVPGSYLDRVASGKYPRDAFSLGQLVSKGWLIDTLAAHQGHHGVPTIAMLGCWVGAGVEPLLRKFNIKRIYGFDSSPEAISLAEEFNAVHVVNDWKFKGVVADVDMLDLDSPAFETGGELITERANWIINTSCEHMSTEWFESVGANQLVIMQTNNSVNFDGHINVCESLNEVYSKYPLSRVVYSGKMVTPLYTRFMQIGFKN